MVIDKDNIKILLLILVLGLGIGYAYINSDLNINGTAQVNSANWDIHWANIQVASGSVSGTNVVTAPTISNSTTVNYSVILNTPGDYYEFTIDAVNAGTIDAMIDTIDSKLNGATITALPTYLKYSITYADGVALESNHQLLHNTIETYKIRIEYRTDIELNQLPATNQSLLLQFTVIYRQATEDVIEVNHLLKYTISSVEMNIGQPIPSAVTAYNTATEALAALPNSPFYLKHAIRNGIVTESYIEFIVTPEMASANPGMTVGIYTIRGLDILDDNSPRMDFCKDEYYNQAIGGCLSTYYASNKATVLTAFGSGNCINTSPGTFSDIDCHVSGLSVMVSSRNVSIGSVDCECGISGFGSSACEY